MDLNTETELRDEIERLNRKLKTHEIHTPEIKPPARASKLTLGVLGLLVVVLVVAKPTPRKKLLPLSMS
jgi:hypothetical protein